LAQDGVQAQRAVSRRTIHHEALAGFTTRPSGARK
jgi:hypothetical protein